MATPYMGHHYPARPRAPQPRMSPLRTHALRPRAACQVGAAGGHSERGVVLVMQDYATRSGKARVTAAVRLVTFSLP